MRHASAGSPARWRGEDRLRPLDPRGRRQADALDGVLRGVAVARVLSSPARRCVQTVEPLAARRGLGVQEAWELMEGCGAEAVGLLDATCGSDTVLSTHGDVVPELLAHLASAHGVDVGEQAEWKKGSCWVLCCEAGRYVSARYLPPAG